MMSRLPLVVLCALLSGCSLQVPESKVYLGLEQEDVRTLHSLIAIKDPKAFETEVIRLRQSGKYRSVLILTHAMFALPWVPELEPKHRGDFRMRKVVVEYHLDQLVAAPLHDKLSAAYFRAIVGKEGDSVEETKRAMLDWTIQNRTRLEWRDGRFSPSRSD